MNMHDLGYSRFFSHARMVQDLIEGFIREDWITGLDFSTLEKVNPVYVSDDFRKRINDLVWKIRWQGTDRWIFIYLILEPQSTVDTIMALRTDLYTKLLYQDLYQSRQIPDGQKFPPVLPIVLYNGRNRWTAALDVADLITEYPPGLEIYRPRMRYLLIDEHRYQQSELQSMQNVVAALFRLEKSRTLEDVRQVIQELDRWLQGPEQRDLRRTFAGWLSRILLPRLFKKNPDIPNCIPEMNDLKEVHTMLAETVEGWTRDWEHNGRRKEAAVILLKQLRRKFGQVPEQITAKVTAADLELIETWSENFVFANSMDEVFAC
ncbi:MAG: Rpn family recombination-promoting nuclease/putative transposase [Magnetococcus sp. DMHC-1]|nr:Rpn family recombination-promoting nuclease/putative transposase [Magnetococcales bacterium]